LPVLFFELVEAPKTLEQAGKASDPVVLELQVDSPGHCEVLGLVLDGSQNAGRVSDVVTQWRFKPAQLNGKPVTVHGRLRYLLGTASESLLDTTGIPSVPTVR
jgi:hypothetical protein